MSSGVDEIGGGCVITVPLARCAGWGRSGRAATGGRGVVRS